MILRSILAVIAFLAVGSLSFFAAHQTRLVWFDAAAAVEAAAKYDAKIVRDRYGVPHISGQRDADVAFGLAFAHAQDDFPTLQRAVLAARGRLANVDGIQAAQGDFLVHLLGIWSDIDERYETDLSEPTRALLDGYAAGVNLYAAQHRGDVLPEAVPVKGQDIVALFMLRLPFFYGLDEQLRVLLAGGEVEIPPRKTAAARALAIAIAPSREMSSMEPHFYRPEGRVSCFSCGTASLRSIAARQRSV